MFSKNPRHWLIRFVIGCGQFWLVLRTAEETNDLHTRRNQGWRCVQSFSSPMRNSGASKGKGRSPNREKTPAFFGARRFEVQILCSARGHVNARFRCNQARACGCAALPCLMKSSAAYK